MIFQINRYLNNWDADFNSVFLFQENKVVLLEDLASHFGLRTQQAIDRVQDMMKDGILSGRADMLTTLSYNGYDQLFSTIIFFVFNTWHMS